MVRTPIHPSEILTVERNVSTDTALRLGRYFGTSLTEPANGLQPRTRPAPRSAPPSSGCRPHVVNL